MISAARVFGVRGVKIALIVYAAVFALGGMLSRAGAEDYPGITAKTVKKAGTTSNGTPIVYPRTNDPEVTALVVEIPPGGETGWHLHPVPVYAYVLSGLILIESENGVKQEFREGEAIFENVGTPHNGKNEGWVPVMLVVFYTGETSKPNTLKVKPPAP